MIIVFDRTHTIYVAFQSRGFYDVPFQALPAILDWLTHLASISCWYWSDARQDEFRFQKCEVMTMSVVGGQLKKEKNANPSHKATRHMERTFLISDYY